MMGLYPYKNTQKSEAMQEKALPPMKTRSRISATIDGMTLLPVFNYVKQNIYDDISWQGCKYAAGNRNYKYSREQSYSNISPYVINVMKNPIGQSFNLTTDEMQTMNYTTFYGYSDILISEIFEGNPKRYNFTNMQWTFIRNSQKIILVQCYDPDVRTLWVTKKMRKPIQAIKDTVAKYLNGTVTKDDLKYFIHSAHDTQLWNVVEFLQSVNYDPID